jgi:hypothetical protein
MRKGRGSTWLCLLGFLGLAWLRFFGFLEHVSSTDFSTLSKYILNRSIIEIERMVVTNRSDSDETLTHLAHLPAENCSNYQGIMLITHFGTAEGTGTAFFNLIVDQLIYAEMYNLQPWFMPDNLSQPCFDENVHTRQLQTQTFRMVEATPIRAGGEMQCKLIVRGIRAVFPYPGAPQWDKNVVNLTVTGNSLWRTYFRPISTVLCQNLQAVDLKPFIDMPGLHKCSPFGVRSWPFRGLPRDVQPKGPLQEWFYPMRQRASRILDKYFYLQPEIKQLVDRVNPVGSRCLALHIRVTDKGNGRHKVPLESFRPYVDVFDGDIYLATDDASVIETVSAWKNGSVRYQESAFRSTTAEPTFALMKNNTHRTNVESLVDVYAMARCSFFLHGFSAMAEAVIYLNLELHNRSVNLDDAGRLSVEDFRDMIQKSGS